ncbi:hypothetical protein JKP88DRAFT_299741 [Tribonema minus]|uniref:Uncharacterized protein n=1 Tax=Tribonema minus TaxID=303371 RepID=A0A835ZCZ3_9STRA|nr:hypothetical protein JKP88DRAFT_299741 [Tribonema minus]
MLAGLLRRPLGEADKKPKPKPGKPLPPATGTRLDGIRGRPYLVDRRDTCKRLMDMADRTGYVIVRAPHQTGKTSLLQLCERHLAERGVATVFFDASADTDADAARAKGMLAQALSHELESVVILIDNADELYDKYDYLKFWRLLKALGRGGSTVRVVLAVAHGTRLTGASASGVRDAAVRCDVPEAVVTLFRAPRGGRPSLQLTREEWLELWQRFLVHTELQLGDVVRDHVYATAAAQPGLIMHCLDYLETEMTSEQVQLGSASASAMNVLCSAAFHDTLNHLRSILGHHNYLGYEHFKKVPHAYPVLRQLLWGDSMDATFEVDDDDWEKRYAVRETAEALLGTLRYSSPLHRLWGMRRVYPQPKPTSVRRALRDLILSAVAQLDPYVLQRTAGARAAGNAALRRAWETELTRCFLARVAPETVPSVCTREDDDGAAYTDIFLAEPYNALVEVTRDAYAAAAAAATAAEGDNSKAPPLVPKSKRYAGLYTCGPVRTHILLDFCSPASVTSAETAIDDERLYSVRLASGYRRAFMCRMGEVIGDVTVEGSAGAESRAVL